MRALDIVIIKIIVVMRSGRYPSAAPNHRAQAPVSSTSFQVSGMPRLVSQRFRS